MRPVLVIALLAAGCSTSWDPHAPKTVTASGDGGAVTVKHGQRLHLPLAAEPGSAYEWRLAEPPVRMVVAQGPGDQRGLACRPHCVRNALPPVSAAVTVPLGTTRAR